MSMVDNIKKAAKSNGLTLAALERTLGFGNGTIRKWDENEPSLKRVIEVANMLNTTIDWLIAGEGDMRRSHNVSSSINDISRSIDEELLIENYRNLPIDEQKKLIKHVVISAAKTTSPPMSEPHTTPNGDNKTPTA